LGDQLTFGVATKNTTIHKKKSFLFVPLFSAVASGTLARRQPFRQMF